ncbi:MAG: FAD-binding protein [Acidimicrobiales bacterium]|nr:FAD-binding protein [Acidimicrobiales bacterium]
MAKTHSSKTWSNWAGNQTSHPLSIEKPKNEEDVVSIVREAKKRGLKVKVVGSGHSFTGIAVADEVLVSLDDIADIRDVDFENFTVRVGSGIKLFDLNPILQRSGLAMPNLGDIVYQSISGAISTSTHGTGLQFKTIADAVCGMRIVNGEGKVIECDKEKNTEVFHAARVGLGALGIITEVTIQCVEAFNLHAIEEILPIGEVTNNFDRWSKSADHIEFFWMPNTDKALLKRNTRTLEAPPRPRNKRHSFKRRWNRFKNEEIKQNVLFGAMNHLGKIAPPLVPKLNSMVAGESGRAEYITTSYEVFASPRRVRFYEMEYAVPINSGIEAFRRVVELIGDLDHYISFPVEYRVLGKDEIPMSTASERDSAFIAVHVFRNTPFEKYFQGVEEIMADYEGRPHWGKLHFQDHETLSNIYPQWEVFQNTRRLMDPSGIFTNPYLDKVLGPLT